MTTVAGLDAAATFGAFDLCPLASIQTDGLESLTMFHDRASVEPQTASLRILQLIHSSEAGGVEALAASIAYGLTAHGMAIDTHFLYRGFASGKWPKVLGILRTILRIIRARPDVLIAYQSTASVLVGLVGTICGIPLRIVHQTSVPAEVHPVVCFIDKWLGCRPFYTANIANTNATMHAYADYPPAYRQRMILIEHGLVAPRSRSTRRDTLARFEVPAKGPILFTAGRLSDQKAHDVLIRALPMIDGAQLVIAGGGPNETEYRQLAVDLGVAHRTHLIGYVTREDIGDLLGATDVFVFPTRWETFGLAPVEAAMSAIPIVASDLDVLREVLMVDNRSCATFVKTNDPALWAQTIVTVLGNAGIQHQAVELAPLVRAKYAEERMISAYARLITLRTVCVPRPA